MKRFMKCIYVIAAVVILLVMGSTSVVSLQYQNVPDRSLTNEDAFYGGKFEIWTEYTRIAANTVYDNMDGEILQDAEAVFSVRAAIETLLATHVSIQDLEGNLDGDPEEINEALLGIYDDLAIAGQGCLDALEGDDPANVVDCTDVMMEPAADFEDLYASYDEWLSGDGFSYNRD